MVSLPDSQAGTISRIFYQALQIANNQHIDELAPSDDILSDYRKDNDWDRYVQRFEA